MSQLIRAAAINGTARARRAGPKAEPGAENAGPDAAQRRRLAWHESWHGVADNSSAMRAISAMARVIGAASAHGERGRTYGKEKVYGSIP
jgi:hypothetical protein